MEPKPAPSRPRRGAQPGQAHPSAKLTNATVAEIKRRRAAGETGIALAREYGITASHVSMIHRGWIWSSVPAAPAGA